MYATIDSPAELSKVELSMPQSVSTSCGVGDPWEGKILLADNALKFCMEWNETKWSFGLDSATYFKTLPEAQRTQGVDFIS